MGCGASSQSSAMEPNQSSTNGSLPSGTVGEAAAAAAVQQGVVVNQIHNWDEKSSQLQSANGLPRAFVIKEMKAPVAFEVSGEDGETPKGDSIIKAHPPRRLRRLGDEQTLTPEEVANRLALADQRRNEILQERVKSARLLTAKGPRRNQLSPIAIAE